ncbi:Protein of unknown function [Pyronema omphalodes CBS 100304]|uniref:Uncharacterized protein n=1 Tax=Pyronema omphalodes (strain CBS 100304) TaxID=1076935 RepID=U4LIK5_PYROM|nr:Protein of unknown function [Pyronema omphalodes CBS 100304]
MEQIYRSQLASYTCIVKFNEFL